VIDLIVDIFESFYSKKKLKNDMSLT